MKSVTGNGGETVGSSREHEGWWAATGTRSLSFPQNSKAHVCVSPSRTAPLAYAFPLIHVSSASADPLSWGLCVRPSSYPPDPCPTLPTLCAPQAHVSGSISGLRALRLGLAGLWGGVAALGLLGLAACVSVLKSRSCQSSHLCPFSP